MGKIINKNIRKITYKNKRRRLTKITNKDISKTTDKNIKTSNSKAFIMVGDDLYCLTNSISKIFQSKTFTDVAKVYGLSVA
ncbi:MAG: hypothetical protein N2201_05175 [candidate division WOR-3 bacterium]|nr:hypothetical protein [candidate division WOR-3 bacterium]